MSANISETKAVAASPVASPATPPIPKRITNAQTVCNERNEKNKLCNGHLKQLKTAGEAAEGDQPDQRDDDSEDEAPDDRDEDPDDDEDPA